MPKRFVLFVLCFAGVLGCHSSQAPLSTNQTQKITALVGTKTKGPILDMERQPDGTVYVHTKTERNGSFGNGHFFTLKHTIMGWKIVSTGLWHRNY